MNTNFMLYRNNLQEKVLNLTLQVIPVISFRTLPLIGMSN